MRKPQITFMNIGIDIRCLMEKNYSGISYYTLNLLRAIFEHDHENNYFLFYNSFRDVSTNIPKFDYPNVHIVATRYPNKLFNLFVKLGFIKLDRLIASEAKKQFNNLAIGQFNCFFAPSFNFINLSKNCPLILVVHDLSFEIYPEFFALKNYPFLSFLGAGLWYKYVNTRKLCQRAKKIITVSEGTKRDLVKIYGIDENKVEVVYPGVMIYDLRFMPPTDGTPPKAVAIYEPDSTPSAFVIPAEAGIQVPRINEIKEKQSLSALNGDNQQTNLVTSRNYILYIGNLEPRKNIDSLLLAFDKLREEINDIKLVIAGADAWRYQNIYKVWQEMKYKNEVEFLGYVSAEEKNVLLQNAKVFTYPSYYEGFGFPPLEAQATGVPVVVGANSSLVEAIGNSGLLVDPYNINEIKEALKQILTDEKLRQDLISKGYENVKRFDWRETAQKILKLI